jgi:hypothetical protein
MTLSYRLLRLWNDYCSEYRRVISVIATYGRNAQATLMRGSVVKAALEAYFVELEKHVDQEPDIYRPGPREGA